MRLRALLLAVLIALAAPALAAAQGGTPFGPLTPPQPAPPPVEEPEPSPAPEGRDDDQELGLAESLVLAGIAALLIGGVGFMIWREGGALGRRARRARRAAGARPVDPRKRGAAAFRTTGTGDSRRERGTAPPPPPRKRRPKAKSRRK